MERRKRFDCVAVNDLADAKTLAHLLKYDSVFGKLEADVRVEDGNLVVGRESMKVLSERDPTKLPWKELGVDLVIEATGVYRDRKGASKHLDAGAKKVLITAPAEDPDITIVPGINDRDYDPQNHVIISLGSCTTNCVIPVMYVLEKRFGVDKALLTTAHAYTPDQRLLDIIHKDLRRARAAPLSIVPTTTGAARAAGEVVPALKGIFDGVALRVPVPDVSVIDVVALLKRDTTVEEVNAAFREAAEGELKGILECVEEPLVSTDFIGNPNSAIVDPALTMIVGGNLIKLMAWYDNEWGYSCRLVDMANLIAEKMG